MTDDKENHPLLDGPPPLTLEQKQERALKRLQRRNSNSKRTSNASSTATRKELPKTGESRSDSIQMSALTAWMNKMLAPSDSLKIGDQADIDLVLNDFHQMKGLLSNKTADQTQHQQLRQVPEDPKNNDLIQYFLKSTSDTNLVKQLEALLSSSNVLADIAKIVDQEKIAVRRDVKVFSNIGIQALLCSILMNFQPVWLCTAMEFIFKRKMTFPRDADGRMKYVSGMSNFILRNVLDNSAAFANNRKYMLGQSKALLTEAGIDAMHKDFLGKFLSILFLIETMLVNNLLPDVPCMFWPSSKYKSINDVLTVLSREIATGTSSMKHLQTIGFRVVYRQGFFEEYKYVVNDFQNDLRNGIVLARVVEVLSAKLGRNHVRVVDNLRNPSGDRLRKVYNVRHVVAVCALQFPSRFGPNDFNADDIVAGKCGVLIEFVWRLVGVVLGDEVNSLRRDFMKNYEEKEQAEQKEQSPSTRGLDLPELIEMKRLNLAAARIQKWWLVKRAGLIKRAKRTPVEVVTEACEDSPAEVHEETARVCEEVPTEVSEEITTKLCEVCEKTPTKVCEKTPTKVCEKTPTKVCDNVPVEIIPSPSQGAFLVQDKGRDSIETYKAKKAEQQPHVVVHPRASIDSNSSLTKLKRFHSAAGRIQRWWLKLRIKRATRNRISVVKISSQTVEIANNTSEDYENELKASDECYDSVEEDQDFVENSTAEEGEPPAMTHSPDLSETIEMERRNRAAARIQRWWRVKNAAQQGEPIEQPIEVVDIGDGTPSELSNRTYKVHSAKDNNDVKLDAGSLPQTSQTSALSDELMKFRERTLEVTKNTLHVHHLMSQKKEDAPAPEHDGERVFSPFSYEEFKRHLDDRRKNARYVGIPMRRSKKSTSE